jgi:hypothetical protein
MPDAMTSPILILGAPRSGTTWLAKIIDSHPDVLYRHEPDATLPGPSPMTADALPGLLARWIADRTPRSVAKQPFFAKSWQSTSQRYLRNLLANAVSAADRLPPPFQALARLPIPDFACAPAKRVAIKSINWAPGANVLARSLPNSRTIFILRHPCGQVCSIMRGRSQHRFELKTEGADMPFDEDSTTRFAAQFGIDETTFQALPDAAKYSWSWRAFNEPAYAALAPLPNVQVVRYMDLCAHPAELARQIMTFTGLDWHQQTQDFVERSTTHQAEIPGFPPKLGEPLCRKPIRMRCARSSRHRPWPISGPIYFRRPDDPRPIIT